MSSTPRSKLRCPPHKDLPKVSEVLHREGECDEGSLPITENDEEATSGSDAEPISGPSVRVDRSTSKVKSPKRDRQAELLSGHAPSEERRHYNSSMESVKLAWEKLREAEEALRAATEIKDAAVAAAEAIARAALEEGDLDALLSEPTEWNCGYRALVAFRNSHGHCRVPVTKMATPDEKKLTRWVRAQRTVARRPPDHPNAMDPFRRVALERVGFVFEPRGTMWLETFEKVKTYKDEHGTLPQKKFSKKCPLTAWVKTYRRKSLEYEKGKRDILTEKQFKLLKELGVCDLPTYYNSLRSDGEWGEYCSILSHMNRIYGHCDASVLKDDPDLLIQDLSNWTQLQRKRYIERSEGSEGVLTDEKIRQLETVGFLFHLKDEKWIRMYRKLKAYRDKFKTTVVLTFDGSQGHLPTWVGRQRQLLTLWCCGDKSCLADWQVEMLDKVGLEQMETMEMQREALRLNPPPKVTPPAAVEWATKYNELLAYREKFKTLVVIPAKGEYEELSKWAPKQSRLYKKWKEGNKLVLSKEQAEKLGALGFPLDVSADMRKDAETQHLKFAVEETRRNWDKQREIEAEKQKALAKVHEYAIGAMRSCAPALPPPPAYPFYPPRGIIGIPHMPYNAPGWHQPVPPGLYSGQQYPPHGNIGPHRHAQMPTQSRNSKEEAKKRKAVMDAKRDVEKSFKKAQQEKE